MSKLVPKYTAWEAINAALAVGVKALEEVRTLARTPGKDGARGEQGPAGSLAVVRAWDDRIHYQSDVVTHAGATWQALCDTGRPPPHQDWICLAARGEDAPVGTVCGLFDPAKAYRRFDIVTFNGSEWRAVRDDPGELPGDGWMLGAKGSRGKPGERGERGPAGPHGRSIVDVVVSGYDIAIVYSDGAVLTRSLEPMLEQYYREAML